MEIVSIAAAFGLAETARIDPKHVEQKLDILGPALADHGESDATALVAVFAANGYVAVSLEDALEVRD